MLRYPNIVCKKLIYVLMTQYARVAITVLLLHVKKYPCILSCSMKKLCNFRGPQLSSLCTDLFSALAPKLVFYL